MTLHALCKYVHTLAHKDMHAHTPPPPVQSLSFFLPVHFSKHNTWYSPKVAPRQIRKFDFSTKRMEKVWKTTDPM